MIALIDYGAGNLTSVRKALHALGAEFTVPRQRAECAAVSGIIVPGVGHFGATSALQGEWRDAIGDAVAGGTPLLGICLGMQWLFEGSDEAPDVPGLGVMAGRITRLTGDPAQRLKIPHVGWNALEFRRRPPAAIASASPGKSSGARLLATLADGAQVYFTHSYAAPVTADCVAAATHAQTFSAVVERDRIFGVQFHPEKSSDAGLTMIRNFLEVCR